jgi:hypothetical protein
MRPFPDMSVIKTPEDLRILKDCYDALRNWRPKIRMMVRGTRIGTVTLRPFGDLPEVQGAGPPGCVPPLDRLTPGRRAIVEMTRDIARVNAEAAWREERPWDLSQYATDVSGNPMPQWQATAPPSFDDAPATSAPEPTPLPDDPDEAVEVMATPSGLRARLEAERQDREALRDLLPTLGKPVTLPEFGPLDYPVWQAPEALPTGPTGLDLSQPIPLGAGLFGGAAMFGPEISMGDLLGAAAAAQSGTNNPWPMSLTANEDLGSQSTVASEAKAPTVALPSVNFAAGAEAHDNTAGNGPPQPISHTDGGDVLVDDSNAPPSYQPPYFWPFSSGEPHVTSSAIGSQNSVDGPGLRLYQTGSYKDLKALELPFDGIHVDHQPPHAANVMRVQTGLQQALKPDEIVALRDNSPAVAVPSDWHVNGSPTYGGRLTFEKIQAAAINPVGSVIESSDSMVASADPANRAAAERAANQLRMQAEGPLVNSGVNLLEGTADALNAISRPLTILGAGVDAYRLGSQIDQSLQTGNWRNSEQEAARIAGGWTGAWVGAEAGSNIGSAAGLLGGPFWEITVPAGYVIGGFFGGMFGYALGGAEAQSASNMGNASGENINGK